MTAADVAALPPWVDAVTALLLVASGILALSAAVGLVRFQTFFQRMHPLALAYTLSAWCAALATIVHFTARGAGLAPHAWLIIVFLSITVPVTTLLLARTELFRQRTRRPPAEGVPPPLSRWIEPADPAAGPRR